MCRTAIASSQPTSSSVVPAAPSSQISRAASMMRTRVRSPSGSAGTGRARHSSCQQGNSLSEFDNPIAVRHSESRNEFDSPLRG